jgi:hypothetical protein
MDRRAEHISFGVDAVSANGFGIGAKCETYGLYPWAGEWQGVPWEPVDWSVDQLCNEYFGLVRMLLSRDARLRLRYRRNHLQAAVVELRTAGSWEQFEQEGRLVLPLGVAHDTIMQNDHLPPRFPFGGRDQGRTGVYLWRSE